MILKQKIHQIFINMCAFHLLEKFNSIYYTITMRNFSLLLVLSYTFLTTDRFFEAPDVFDCEASNTDYLSEMVIEKEKLNSN